VSGLMADLARGVILSGQVAWLARKRGVCLMKIEIHCPVHGETEILDLPDGYETFEGEVKCPVPLRTGSSGANLKIKILAGTLLSVERA